MPDIIGQIRRTKREILADLTQSKTSQEIPDAASCDGQDNDMVYDMERGPTPRRLIQMSDITTIADIMQVGNKEGDRPERTVPPMIFNGTLNGIPCTMMYDTGAGTSVICSNFAQHQDPRATLPTRDFTYPFVQPRPTRNFSEK